MAASPLSSPPPRPIQKRRYPLWRLIQANFYDLGVLLRESSVVLIGFGLVTLAGTLYLHFSHGDLDYAEALYETLLLLTLQSGLAFPADLLGRVLFFLIPLLGLALIFQSVLNFGRLLLDKGSRREAWQVSLASTYRDHIIVCGLGRVGLRVVSQLVESGYDVVVIEREWNSEFVERTLRLKVPVVPGDGREPAILHQAGVSRARAFVSAISDDLLNIEIALTVRTMRPDLRVILRVFDEDLDSSLERAFGENTSFSTSSLAAPTFAAAAISRDVDYVLPIGDAFLGITQLTVQPDSQLCGFVHAIEEQYGVRVLQYQDTKGNYLRPGLMRQLSSGDRVMLLGSLAALESARLKNIQGSKLDFLKGMPLQRPTEKFNTVLICGLGKVSYRVARRLHDLTPRPNIVVVHLDDKNPKFVRQIRQLAGITVRTGDARDIDVLRKAGLDQAYSVVAIDSDDLLNLQIGLTARRERPDVHLVLSVFSDALADKLADLFGIHTTYSTSGLAAPTLAAAAVLGDVRYAFFADHLLFAADDVVIRPGSMLAGQTVESIRAAYGALVIGHRRNSQVVPLPALDSVVEPGDEVTLLATIEDLTRIRALLDRRPAAPRRTALRGDKQRFDLAPRWKPGPPGQEDGVTEAEQAVAYDDEHG